MRHLLLTVVAGGVMAMIGWAGAQTLLPDISPQRNTIPPGSPSSSVPSSPTGAPCQQASNSSATVPAGSMTDQLKAQQKDIETLFKTVGLLTEQLQRVQLGTTTQAAGVGVVQQAEAKQPATEPVPETTLVAQASEELRKTQQALAELEKQQAAAAQADDPLKKQLELQRKQIDLLNRMVKLLASELEKQVPAVSKMQTQVATLEARSKQSAQRDRELANGLDNLTEHVDATDRNGPSLPAQLKEWFLPGGTNETPLSIYNALSFRYNEFINDKGVGKFQFIEYDPIILLQLNKQFLFESQLEVHTNGIEPEFAQVDWMATDWLTVVGGRFMTPIGSFNERLHYLWINKLPDFPIFAWAVVPFDFNLNGVQLRGSKYLFGSPVKMEYAFYAANGWGVPGMGAVTDFVNIQGQTDGSKTINNSIAYGGRVGMWLPSVGFNGGVSYFGNRPYTRGTDAVNVDMWDVDLNYHIGNWDARFEAGQTFQNTTPFIGNNILLQGLYAQIAYRPYDVANQYLQKTEAVFRYSLFRGSGYTPNQLDLTAFTFRNQVPVSRNQYTFGVNYYPYPSMALRVAFEINQEIGVNLKDNALLAGFFWAF
jgi:hypothetical protein